MIEHTKGIRKVASPIMKAMITTAYIAGISGVIIVAPNALQAINLLSKKNNKIKTPKSIKFHYYAYRSGYFDVKEISSGKYAITLTSKGKKIAKSVAFNDYKINAPPIWDKKWRVLMFDIEEKDRYFRDILRFKINELDMQLVQNSVYIYPHPIDDFISLMHKTYGNLAKHVISMTVTKIDGEDQLIKLFKNKKII